MNGFVGQRLSSRKKPGRNIWKDCGRIFLVARKDLAVGQNARIEIQKSKSELNENLEKSPTIYFDLGNPKVSIY